MIGYNLLAASAVALSGTAQTDHRRRVMPWLCLEICDTPAAVQQQLQTIRSKRALLSAVSFELYTLEPNCSLMEWDNVTRVHTDVRNAGLDSWPMITSWPHPPDFITRMRQLFADRACAETFVAQAVAEAQRNGFTGYNLDWEPTWSNSTAPIGEADAQAFAQFVAMFADRLHAAGFQLTVDVATWVPAPPSRRHQQVEVAQDRPVSIWNYTALAATSVDRAISMGTYTSSDTSFADQLHLLMSTFGPDRSGVGLMTVNASDGVPLSDAEVALRFRALEAANATEVDVWRMPLTGAFWSHVEAWVNGSASQT